MHALLDPVFAQGVARAKGVKVAGTRTGNWLTRPQAEQLLPIGRLPPTLKGRRDRALLTLFIGSRSSAGGKFPI